MPLFEKLQIFPHFQGSSYSVSISDSDAIRNIYVANSGFPKDARYTNFNLGPVVSIFSAIDTEYRNTRAKAVAPLFAPARLRVASEPHGVIGRCAAEFVDQLRAFKTAEVKVDIVDLSARLSIDVVTEYLLGERYGGLGEHTSLSLHDRRQTKLSANPFIFAIVAFSRFSLLPNWIFRFVYTFSSWINSSDEVVRSFVQLERFIDRVMGSALSAKDGESPLAPADSTYQGRLLQVGISRTEAAAQSKAIVFAGADSTAVMLATILFHLVNNAHARARLLREIRCSKLRATTPNNQDTSAALTDPQTLPYLRAVVKEGLRLGMANPTRLTRVVPATGLCVGSIHLPPGTVVGCAAYMLHHDPDVFPDPFAFRPERWLEDGQDEGLRRPDMEKSMIPFGAGLRACIGKNLAQQQLYETVMAVVDSEVLVGARTCQQRIEMIEWFNGFGLSLARCALQGGHKVIATSRNPSRTPDLVSEVEGKGGKWIGLDVTDSKSAQVVDNLEKSGDQIDILVNNAGYSVFTPVETITEDELRAEMETMYFGPLRLIRAVIPHMRKRKFGVIVNMSSGAALEGNPSMGIYAGAKAGLDGVTRVLAKEVAPFNIRTLTVVLGTFNTSMPSKAVFGTVPLPDDYSGSFTEKMIQAIKSGQFVPNGDKDKAMKAVYEVVVGEGIGAGHESEKLLPLGADMAVRVKTVQNYLAHSLEVFGDVTNNVNLDK
ncbi:hypothetical protein DV737_g5366, partial [Chaetothyriales sp. CBS 132003]